MGVVATNTAATGPLRAMRDYERMSNTVLVVIAS